MKIAPMSNNMGAPKRTLFYKAFNLGVSESSQAFRISFPKVPLPSTHHTTTICQHTLTFSDTVYVYLLKFFIEKNFSEKSLSEIALLEIFVPLSPLFKALRMHLSELNVIFIKSISSQFAF